MTQIYKYEGYELTVEPSELQDMFTGSCKELGFHHFHFLDNIKRGFMRVVNERLGLGEQYPLTVTLSELLDIVGDDDEDEEEQVQYGNEILAQDLFNSMLRYYPEALPEVIEVLDKLHNQYKGRIK